VTEAALAIALVVLAGGTLLVWPSRWNIPVFIDLAFTVPTYLVPLFLTQTTDQFGHAVLTDLTALAAVGAVVYLGGILIGFAIPRFRVTGLRFTFASMGEDRFVRFARRRTFSLFALGVLGLYASFAIMGYIPMFAHNPLAAKYFHGAYRPGYLRAAVLHRISYWTVLALIPVAAAVWYETGGAALLILLLLGSAGAAMTLNRGPIGFQALLAIGLIAAERGGFASATFVITAAIVLCLGSAANYILAVFFGVPVAYVSLAEPAEVWRLIAALDLRDTLRFITNFRDHPHFTHGLTLVGGLVPLQYKWNPSLWALGVVSGASRPQDLPAGGIRMPVPVWGYAAFGWFGVVTVSALSGLISGYAARFARRHTGNGSLLRSAVALGLYVAVAHSGYGFPTLELHYFPPILIMLLLAYNVVIRWSDLTAYTSIAQGVLSPECG
jgi:hypothetical protein